ncbi:hypothetical protein F4604DRAFT_2039446 [Suillus subluteus]|nr:hypothetical protein F4604DRAFT_2039446 [Suillus subluteus]
MELHAHLNVRDDYVIYFGPGGHVTTTAQPRTDTPNEHVRVDVSVHVFDSENPRHHSQHYTSDVHTTPALQHLPAPLQPALASRLPPNEVRDQPRKKLPIPAQVSSSTTRMVDEPPQKPPARASVVHQPQVPKTQPQVPTSGDIEWDVWPDGAPGNEQWGKDAGTHQDRWNPYEGLPEYWNHGDRDPYAPEFEGKLDCGPNFSEGSEPEVIKKEKHTKKPKPRPRPRKVHKGKGT